ncbi:Major facilitator superfamily domain-containing protein 5 [Trichinella murrelli]|uniref:Transcription initiation factor TFIID subunit 12 n=1 Tax=Trichinella murrelli TaxID=144512 RepID=A0A0V0TQ22_9BILA|nr:Major facilitator superfamily domain-containing protein 5 [Trichinella murrelli]
MLPNLKSETKLPLISGDRFDALLRQVDPNAVLDEDVRRALMKEADQFIEQVLTKACQLTKHRRGNTLETRDVLTVLDRCYNIHLPGKSGISTHSDDFWILLIGRFLGGIATSLLYSAFESWLVCESFKEGFEEPHLKAVFANVVLGNSIVAIVSGIIAQYAADVVGLVGPFDVSAVVLLIMVILVATTWSENYGNEHWSLRDSVTQAVKIIANNKRVAYLGLVQSLFEGSMYTFVLEWTPVLTAAVLNSPDPKDRFLPHGLVFASFMICIMIGSSVFKLMANIWRPEFFMKYIFLCAAASLTFPVFLCLNSLFVFMGFAIFEICVGVFWPASSFMRSVHVPEKGSQIKYSPYFYFHWSLTNWAFVTFTFSQIDRDEHFSYTTESGSRYHSAVRFAHYLDIRRLFFLSHAGRNFSASFTFINRELQQCRRRKSYSYLKCNF